jgi:hypothetical protein
MGLILTFGYSDSRVRWRRLLLRPSIPLLRRWPRADPADRRFGPAVQGLIVGPPSCVVFGADSDGIDAA